MQQILSVIGYLVMFVLAIATLNFLICSPLKQECWGGQFKNPYFNGALK